MTKVFNAVSFCILRGKLVRLPQELTIKVRRDVRRSISSNKCSKMLHSNKDKYQRELRGRMPFDGKEFCFVVISKNLRLLMLLIPLGISSSFSHSSRISVCRFCSLQIESGSFLIWRFLYRSRYLKCFKLPIELGKTSKLVSLKFSTRKYLNLESHLSMNRSLLSPFLWPEKQWFSRNVGILGPEI